MQGRDHGDAVGDHLLRLLRRRALPDAERAGRLAADRGGERHRAVDQDLARPQRLAQVVEVLRLGAEGDGEEDDLGALRGLLVEQALDLGAGDGLAQLRRRLLGALGRARADRDRHAGRAPSAAPGRRRGRRCRRRSGSVRARAISASRRSLCSTRANARLEGRKALVTGGASGIGAAIAARLAAEGAEVWVGDIDVEGAERVAGEVDGHALELDVTDLESARAAVEAIGTLDILVNNAGTDEFGFFTYTTPEQWQRVLAVNLGGVLNCTHAALPGMQQAGYGRIVSISSEAGRVGSKGSAVYSAAKGGIVAFMKAIARENARYGITANSIAPGPIETPLLMGAKEFGEIGEKVIETMKEATQMKRLGQPDEVAAAVAFLASDDATYVTGETLGVSGGLGMV